MNAMKILYMDITLTVCIFCLESFGVLNEYGEHNNFLLFFSGRMQQTIVMVWRYAKRTLSLQKHFLFVMGKLLNMLKKKLLEIDRKIEFYDVEIVGTAICKSFESIQQIYGAIIT